MTTKKTDRIRKWCFALIIFACFGLMVCGYVTFPIKTDEKPKELLLRNTAGPIVFPHARHSADDGAAVECVDCHHKYTGTKHDTLNMKCRACHYSNTEAVQKVCADDDAHPRCVGMKCNICHEGEECTFCHRTR